MLIARSRERLDQGDGRDPRRLVAPSACRRRVDIRLR
jgi:hypothetical protein